MTAREDLLDAYGRAETAPLGTMADLHQALAEIRAEALRDAADGLVSACPEHGDSDEAWMDCPCEYAEEVRRTADLIVGGAS